MRRLSAYLHLTTQFFCYFLVFTTPFLWSSQNSELFEFPKMTFVYAMAVVIVGLWLARMLVEKRPLITRTGFDLVLGLFFLSQLLSTLFSIHPRTSIFGYYSRFHGGLLSTIAYLALYYAFVSNFDRNSIKRVLMVLIASLAGVVLYALPEHFGYAFSCLAVLDSLEATCWIQDIVNRSFGTFGQPNWLAAYIITLFPLLWAFTFTVKSNRFRGWLLLGLYSLQAASFTELLFTKSKSGLIGFAAAFVLFWMFTFLQLRRRVFIRLLPSLALVVSLALIVGTEYSPSLSQLSRRFAAATPITQVQETEATASAALSTGTVLENGDLSIPFAHRAGTQSGTIRQIVWTGALTLLKSHPLFGTGVETFAYAYYKARPAQHNLVSEWDFLYNKAHNEFLNFASTTGFFGLFTYLAVLLWFFAYVTHQLLKRHSSTFPRIAAALVFSLSVGALFQSPAWLFTSNPLILLPLFLTGAAISGYLAWRYFRTPPSPNAPAVSASLLITALIAGYLALAVSNFFGFSTVSVGLLFFLFPAFAVVLTRKNRSATFATYQPNLVSESLNWWQSLLLGAVGIGMIVFLISISNQYFADIAYNKAKTAETLGQVQVAASQYQKAIQLRPAEPTFHNDYADLLAKLAFYYGTQEQVDMAGRYAQAAVAESAQTLTLNPVHLNFYKSQAGVFIRLSTLDPALLKQAEAILIRATELSPTEAKLYYNLGLIYLDTQELEAAARSFRQAVDLKPNYEQARLQLADLFILQEQFDDARQQYQYIIQYINPESQPARQGLESLQS